ncbi:MAG TPA: PaaI family thioesterase [Gammaproteobacteria bacterium]|nr:PaaI family thioesterase [Gammaproteobacteria bacterium]
MPTAEELNRFLVTEFPQSKCTVERCGEMSATVRRRITHADLRPGDTVSGPVMMEVADNAIYLALLATIGIEPMAVTTTLTINYLRKPAATRDLIGECRLLKVGRTLATGEVLVYSEGEPAPVAQATGTYALPRKS